ncbi:MAG TPA: bifunctional serine/threonine-protein kinase/formylglycine-generating enzyme family protein [Gemmatimonadaceae bacterium]|nr:bifunctional serine/threonine-protein kinase/formylglycine-generating enzyme family protein [Gemmatimonadaceae bacterium]
MTAVRDRLQAALGDLYVIERELGAGGFAVVYLVRDTTLKRLLAVKVLSPEMISSAVALERFRREAETVAQLSHPNIVPLHFLGDNDGLLFLAMGFVDGGSLNDRLSDAATPMPFAVIARALSEVASALAYAHRRGVIHRDIKPHNVLVDSDSGRCLVTDFGIARTATAASLTSTGMLIGTPAYMAPEQVTGEPTDHRADIYALGVMAYEMVAGRRPFDGPTPVAVVMRRLQGPPEPVQNLRPNVPAPLASVIDRCLATDPKDRFQKADEIVELLARATTASSEATVAVPAATAKKRVGLLIGLGIAIVAVGGLIASSARWGTAPPPIAPAVDSEMVMVDSGSFRVGTDTGNAAPVHTVSLETFGIDKHEVAVGDYARFVSATGAEKPWSVMPDSLVPVTGVWWEEAMAFCKWRHGQSGALPTEEQWEAAARGAHARQYPWGAQFVASAANTAVAGYRKPARVGLFSGGATPEGIVDLIGNVWEWTASPMSAYPGTRPFADSLRTFRVIRGGAFNSPTAIATTWYRGYSRPAPARAELQFTGFRCAMTPRDLR